jgi:hypothetical protein
MWWRMNRDEMCCSRFRESLANQGQVGFSIVPVMNREISSRHFRIEFWAVPKAEFVPGSPSGIDTDRPIVISTSLGIRFCPFCGRNLLWFYRLTFESLPGLERVTYDTGDK